MRIGRRPFDMPGVRKSSHAVEARSDWRASFLCVRRVASASSVLSFRAAIAALALSGTVSVAHAAADVSAGEGLFNRCAICHSNTKGGPNGLGPNLFGVVGRKAGTYPGFSYSSAMKSAGFAWTAAKLNDYLASPQKIVPGNNMPFAGIADVKQRTDLVAYLA